MTKMQNTILFIVLGTLANILLMLILIIILSILGGLIFQEQLGTALPFLIIGAMILGMFLYQKLANIIVKKYNLEDKMEPLFKRKNRR